MRIDDVLERLRTAVLTGLGRIGDPAGPPADDVLVELAAGGATLLAGWFAVAAVAGAAARLPGRLGRIGGGIWQHVTPRVIRSAAGVTAGAGIALSGAIPAAALTQVPGVAAATHALQATTVAASGQRDAVLVVRAGDTLWRIAARHLRPPAPPAVVDREWRRWYTANRLVIGADPDLIHPGQRLTPPSRSSDWSRR